MAPVKQQVYDPEVGRALQSNPEQESSRVRNSGEMSGRERTGADFTPPHGGPLTLPLTLLLSAGRL